MSEFDIERANRGEVIKFHTTFGLIEGTVADMNRNNIIVDQVSAFGDLLAIPYAAILGIS